MLQIATPLRKSPLGPPNISDSCVPCIAPARRHASLQILFKCPTPAHVFETAREPLCFSHVWQGAEFLDIPCTCHAKRRFNMQKWREHVAVFACSLRNVLRATTACTFSTSQLPNVLRATTACALFRHLNFQKWSEHGELWTFWLPNLLRASTACTFSTCQCPKVNRTWGTLYILTWKCASRHSGVHFSISHLTRWLRTRHFHETTTWPSGATNHWKNTACRDFSIFSHT